MPNRTKALFIVTYAAHTLWIILLASVPPVSRDAVTHHLAVPKLWVEHGGIYEIPDVLFSYYPQLIDLLYTIPLIFGHDIAAKYIHFSFALLTALIIYLFVRRRISSGWGALAGLLFLTIPLIIKLSVTVYVDLGFIFFTTGALFSVAIWLEETNRTKWLLIAAVCSGLALSCKYNAILSFLILSLLIPFFFLHNRKNKHTKQIKAVRFALLFSCISILIFSPWLIRNYSLTGNPIYPLHHYFITTHLLAPNHLDKQVGSEYLPRQIIEKELLNGPSPLGPLSIRKLVYNEIPAYTMLIPLRIFYEGKDDNPRYFDGKLNLLLLLLPFALLLLGRKVDFHARETILFSSYAILLLLLTFLMANMRIRYVATIIPPMVVLTTYGIYIINKWLLQRFASTKVAYATTSLLISIYLLPNLIYSYDLYEKIDPVPYLISKISRQEYIQKHQPDYASIAMANKVVPPGGKVLGIYLGNRRYYFTVDAVLQNSIFFRIAEESESSEAIADRLTGLGYTHLLLRYDLFNQWLNKADQTTQTHVTVFFSDATRKLKAKEGYGLHEILSPTIDEQQ